MPACSCGTASRRRIEHHPVSRRFCFTLDLKNNPDLIAEYKRYHEKIWPEIIESIHSSGIEDMEIYLLGTRMFMVMDVNESFSFEKKAKADQQNPKVQEWEKLMWKFQQALPQAKSGEKWLRMERIFKLEP
jgi:L-rhamnose mutarotase